MIAWAMGFICGAVGALLVARWALTETREKRLRNIRLLHEAEEVIDNCHAQLKEERRLRYILDRQNRT